VIHKITARTKAIVAVHWGGRACDLDALRQIADEHDLKLIEDAAHALGGTFRGEPVGSHGDFVAFSFQAIKHVTTGDGGLLSCKSPADYERGKLLRWYGIKRPQDLKQDIPEWGYKFHMNDLAATIGIENLKGLQKDLEARRRNAEIYASRLQETVDMESAFWFYPTHREDREKFIQKLSDKGIASGVVHERNDTYSMFKSSAKILPGVDAFCATQVNLPVGPWVELSDIERALA
jgi:dTDP-4-amino-4,6-dideoxygalactose transaminase